MTRKRARTEKPADNTSIPTTCGEQVAADHLVTRSTSQSVYQPTCIRGSPLGHRSQLCRLVSYTRQRTTEARLVLQVLIGPRQSVMSFPFDGAKELSMAAIELDLCPNTYRSHVPQPGFIAERQIRHVEEGARTHLEHSGCVPSWWPYAPRWVYAAANATTYAGASAWSKRHRQGHFSWLERSFRITH